MSELDFIGFIRSESAAFRAAALAGPLDAVVPACPDWTLGDLIFHLTEVHYFWGKMVRHDYDTWEEVLRPAKVRDENLIPTFDLFCEAMVNVLSSRDESSPSWSWSDRPESKTVGWVQRRQAHEAAMHRWDIESAAYGVERAQPITCALAIDGIDEFLAYFAVDRSNTAVPILIEADDCSQRWLLHGDLGPSVGTLRASTASDLLLALWRRIPLDGMSIDGRDGAVEAAISAVVHE